MKTTLVTFSLIIIFLFTLVLAPNQASAQEGGINNADFWSNDVMYYSVILSDSADCPSRSQWDQDTMQCTKNECQPRENTIIALLIDQIEKIMSYFLTV